jgi:hypothetical protein
VDPESYLDLWLAPDGFANCAIRPAFTPVW